eukprot:TRINITY_DN1834_c0_g1_i3.p1 TRINITY_DN1834_c0_g1~~TRINITY_DN1834_c0_g1_i3.p1  ORF type:complete len:241 (-),score=60.64 TRINITY_DN1834_c0_g1_i3:120-842(-)
MCIRDRVSTQSTWGTQNLFLQIPATVSLLMKCLLLTLLLAAPFCLAQSGTLNLANGALDLLYSVNATAGTIDIDLTLKNGNKGWFGIGISPDGTMSNGDFYQCIPDTSSKTMNLLDFKAKADKTLELDTQKGGTAAELKGSSFTDTSIVCKFRRKLNDDATTDLPISTTGNNKLLWAFHKSGNNGVHTNMGAVDWNMTNAGRVAVGFAAFIFMALSLFQVLVIVLSQQSFISYEIQRSLQ